LPNHWREKEGGASRDNMKANAKGKKKQTKGVHGRVGKKKREKTLLKQGKRRYKLENLKEGIWGAERKGRPQKGVHLKRV